MPGQVVLFSWAGLDSITPDTGPPSPITGAFTPLMTAKLELFLRLPWRGADLSSRMVCLAGERDRNPCDDLLLIPLGDEDLLNFLLGPLPTPLGGVLPLCLCIRL